jgi:hypothetical protein
MARGLPLSRSQASLGRVGPLVDWQVLGNEPREADITISGAALAARGPVAA